MQAIDWMTTVLTYFLQRITYDVWTLWPLVSCRPIGFFVSRSALQGNKPTTTPLRLGASQVFYDHDNSFYGNYYQGNAQQLESRSSNTAARDRRSNPVVGCSWFGLLLLFVLSTCWVLPLHRRNWSRDIVDHQDFYCHESFFHHQQNQHHHHHHYHHLSHSTWSPSSTQCYHWWPNIF